MIIASGAGAAYRDLLSPPTGCAPASGHIINSGCLDLKVKLGYLTSDDCDECTVDVAAEVVTQTYGSVEGWQFGAAGTPSTAWFTRIFIQSVANNSVLDTVVFDPPFQARLNGVMVSVETVKSALNNAGYLEKWQAIDPRIDRFDVVQTATTTFIYLFDNENLITSANRIAYHNREFSYDNGATIGGTQISGAFSNITNTYTAYSAEDIELIIPKNSVFPLPEGLVYRIQMKTVNSAGEPVNAQTDQKVSWYSAYTPGCNGCVTI